MKEYSADFAKYTELAGKKYKDGFDCFYRLLTEYNQKFNLTSITGEKDVYYKHFLDSVAGEKLFDKNGRVAEIGSGAGFPSIPLKIVREDLTFTLIESTGKKCEFLNAAVEKLGLKGVEILNARAEDVAKDAKYRESYDVCCARAVARMNTLAEYCMPFVKKGGKFIAYKGEAEEEVREAKRALRILGGGNTEIYRYELPQGYGARSLVTVYKAERTPDAYPRGNGKERSRPLV